MSDFFWTPNVDYIENANATRLMRAHGFGDYRELVERSQEDPEWFWNAVVKDLGLEFTTPYTQVLNDSGGPAWPKWFVGGRVNLTQNCIDRHLPQRAGAPAIVWEGEDGEMRTLTYADLADGVARCANLLLALGVEQGDVVAVFMPMVPENIMAAYAIARVGAIYLPIFSGFGAPAIATRLNDSGAKVLVTADAFYRRGTKVSMKQTADEAVAASSSVQRVVVYRRFPEDTTPMGDRDVDWAEAMAG
ncbi:MAG TPA: AMP-binding protein, partial [Actinomycetota bacterium]|nr:AMP-binding protein [Actinomycetota bacterium]